MLSNVNYGMVGIFRMVVRKSDTLEVVKDTGEFRNMITDYGMNYIAASGIFNGCTVGNGTTPETASDISIQSYVARTQSYAPSGNPAPSVGSTVSPYYSKCTATWRFAAGTAVGNLTEVGVICNYTAPNYQLWSRTLIKDGSGNPITITVLPDEILDVYYEARIYLQSTATTGSMTIGSTTHTYRVLSSLLTSSAHGGIFTRGFFTNANDLCNANNGALGASPNNFPSGTSLGGKTSVTSVPYVSGSFSKGATYSFAPGTATGNIRSFGIEMQPQGPIFGVELTPAYNKLATIELKLTHTISWARRAL